MAEPGDIFSQILGPTGALVATAGAALALWRQHVKDDAARDKTIEYERAQKLEAEERLDDLGATMRAATDVMEKSVAITEKVLDIRAPRGPE